MTKRGLKARSHFRVLNHAWSSLSQEAMSYANSEFLKPSSQLEYKSYHSHLQPVYIILKLIHVMSILTMTFATYNPAQLIFFKGSKR